MNYIKKLGSGILLLMLLLSSVLPISAAQDTLVYSTESNSGTRHVLCTTLEGTGAGRYYTGENTYGRLSALGADELFSALNRLMTSTHTKMSAYSDCRDMAVKTDCEANDGRVNLIYTSYSAARSDYGGSTGTWNREHVWPKSLGGFGTEGPGADLHHIRPSDAKVNSARGNDRYGYTKNGSDVIASGLVGTSVVGGKKGSGVFEPLDNVKGDVARICLYLYVRYGEESSCKCGSVTNVFTDVDTLLEWCALDPVDTWEMGRNEVVAAYQGNRNVFVDYPEYAWLIFGKSIPSGLSSPSRGEGKPEPECEHGQTEQRGARDASCYEDGYSGDIFCVSCGKELSKGNKLPASGVHSNVTEIKDGFKIEKCTVCGVIKKTVAEKDYTALIITLLLLVLAGATAAVVAVAVRKKGNTE